MLSKNRKILLVLIILLVPWGLSQAELREITLPAERLTLNGISLLPINEKGWDIGVHQPHELILVRLGNNTPETYIIRAKIFWPIAKFASQEEFLDFAKKRSGIDTRTDSPRAKNRKTYIKPLVVKDTYCARIGEKAEDHGVPMPLLKSDHMIIESYSLICSHPIKKNIGIEVNFSQRYYPDGRDPELLKKANEVLTSVRFTRIQKLPTEEAIAAAGAMQVRIDTIKVYSNFCKNKYPQFTATIDQGIKAWNKEDMKIITATEYIIGETFKKDPEARNKYAVVIIKKLKELNNMSEEKSLQRCQQHVSGLEAEQWREWEQDDFVEEKLLWFYAQLDPVVAYAHGVDFSWDVAIEPQDLYFVLENIYSVLELDTKGKTH